MTNIEEPELIIYFCKKSPRYMGPSGVCQGWTEESLKHCVFKGNNNNKEDPEGDFCLQVLLWVIKWSGPLMSKHWDILGFITPINQSSSCPLLSVSLFHIVSKRIQWRIYNIPITVLNWIKTSSAWLWIDDIYFKWLLQLLLKYILFLQSMNNTLWRVMQRFYCAGLFFSVKYG